jgi:hypothetical protein
MLNHLMLFLVAGFCAPDSQALSRHDPMLILPDNLPPSVYTSIKRLPVHNVRTGQIRFSPAITGTSRSQLNNLITAFDSDALPFLPEIAVLNEIRDPYTDEKSLVCDCRNILAEDEYIVSETPVLNRIRSTYISINDESYKAIMELIDYPTINPQLITVAFSELAYVYNESALNIFLDKIGFDLVLARGFMNSADYPGFMDTQFFLARSRDSGNYCLSIRGTSGTSDLVTSVRPKLVRWGNQGAALSGFSNVASFIFDELQPFLNAQKDFKQPLTITGHSLGGAVAILLSIPLLANQISVKVITYASPPVGNVELYNRYQEILKPVITNYYLPNEELMHAERIDADRFLKTPGSRQILQHVGTTANAAHYVINYLKSSLLEYKLSRQWYEDSMPHCVLIKYNCFDNSIGGFVPACAFSKITCFNRAAQHVLGFHHASPQAIIDFYRKTSSLLPEIHGHVLLPLMIRSKKLELTENNLDKQQKNLLITQITLYNLLLGRTSEAKRFSMLLENEALNW